MVCPNCGSENVTISMEQVSSKTKKHGTVSEAISTMLLAA